MTMESLEVMWFVRRLLFVCVLVGLLQYWAFSSANLDDNYVLSVHKFFRTCMYVFFYIQYIQITSALSVSQEFKFAPFLNGCLYTLLVCPDTVI